MYIFLYLKQATSTATARTAKQTNKEKNNNTQEHN